MNIAVLGAGMVGSVIALDLAKNFNVTSFDISKTNLELLKQKNDTVTIQYQNLQDFSNYNSFLQPFDLVVCAVPGFMGYEAVKQVILAKKNCVDISFFPENALELNELAVQNNVIAIVDCGVAPGMSNFIIGYYNAIMKIDSFEIYVGGLPKNPQPPFYYKAPFSPVDVIQEYIRPARLKENGVIVTKPALTERELMQFDGVGTLEAFNTDGLRSLLFTMPHIPHQKEKTIRYAGHLDLVIALKQAGFFNEQAITIDNKEITPLQFTSQLLIKEWKLGEEEEEITVMKVIVHGEQKAITYSLFDEYDTETKTSSMARTTGYTCTAAVNLIAKELFIKKGVYPPELIGSEKTCFEFVLHYLTARNVKWIKT